MLDFIKKIWRDPVWSKVIAAGIIAMLAAFAALFTHILTWRVPSWALLVTLAVTLLLVPHWWRAVRKKEPELYMAWDGSAGWGIGGRLQKDGMEHVVRLQGPVVISSSHLTEPVIVTGMELEGAEYAGPHFQMFEVRPEETIRQSLMLNFRGFNPAEGSALKVNLTLVDIKGNRYPLRPTMLRAFPGMNLPPDEPTALPREDSSLEINSPDQFLLRINKADSGGIRGIQLQIENHRLTSIHQVRVILSSASSFDSRHGAFREPSLTGQTFARPDVIRPSWSGKPILLVWKPAQSANLVTGESNVLRGLLWPDRDQTEIQRWRLSLRVLAFDWPANAAGQSTPLREHSADVVVLWNRTRNEFSIEEPTPALTAPEPLAAFPTRGEDGVERKTVRFIMCGPDQLLAYTTTRQNLPGMRFLVVRARPDHEPQSVETPDRDTANARWNEWYQEWKRAGFGGASGNGLDDASPF